MNRRTYEGIPRPMKPCDYHKWKPKFPVIVQPKIDGIRMLVANGVARSSAGKKLPNRHLQRAVSNFSATLQGLDGELVHPDGFSATASIVRSVDKDISKLTYEVFDVWDSKEPFYMRFRGAEFRVSRYRSHRPHHFRGSGTLIVRTVYSSTANNADELLGHLAMDVITDGLPQLFGKREGLILRDPESPYKQGRSTAHEGYLIKFKPYKEGTATVVGFTELEVNYNPAEADAFGLMKRGHSQGERHPAGVLGALICQAPEWPGVTFKIGTGFTEQQRDAFWQHRRYYQGRTVHFKHLPFGAKDRPRHPVFRSWVDAGEE